MAHFVSYDLHGHVWFGKRVMRLTGSALGVSHSRRLPVAVGYLGTVCTTCMYQTVIIDLRAFDHHSSA